MEIIILWIYALTLSISTLVYLFRDAGIWSKIDHTVPLWVDRPLFETIIVLFTLSLVAAIFINKSLIRQLYCITLLLFFFTIFALNKLSVVESFTISSIVLALVIIGLLSLKFFNTIPLLLYIYIYVAMSEINNNYD